MKRFFVEFDFTPCDNLSEDESRLYGGYYDYTKQCHSPTHVGDWRAATLRTAKGYISRIKKRYPSQNPHNFRIFDMEAPLEPCGHVGQVFFQE